LEICERMTTNYKLKVDVAYDWPFHDFCQFCQDHDCTFKVIEAQGPGGGNPYVEFTFPEMPSKAVMEFFMITKEDVNND